MLVGIDPGLKGAISLIGAEIETFAMPVRQGVINWRGVRSIIDQAEIAFIETIWDNRELIEGVGVVRSACVDAGVRVVEVGTQAWQMWAYGRLNKGNKKLSLAWCQRKGFDMNQFNTPDKCESLIIALCGMNANGYTNRIKSEHITKGGGVTWQKQEA